MIRTTAAGVEIDVRVIPRAGKTEWAGIRGGALLLRLGAAPVDGAANEALIEFLSNTLRIPKRAIQIVSGERARQKRVAVAGVAPDAIRDLFR